MAVVGEAFVDVEARVSKDSIGKAEGSITGSMAGIAKKAAAAFAAGFVIKKGIDFGQAAFAAAEESAKVAAQTTAAIKSTGAAAGVSAKQVSDLATSISNKTGVDDEAIQSASNLLLTFTNVKNEAGDGSKVFDRATSTLVDMAAALGTDASGSAIQLGKALNDPLKGITSLTKVGVTFSDQQKDQIKTMVEAGDVAGAQGVILDELGKEFGGSAEAQATAADKMKVALGNVQEALGGLLIPAVSFFANLLTTALPAAVNIATLAIGGLVGAFTEGDITSDGYVGVFERIGVAARTVVDFFVRNWPQIRDTAITVAKAVQTGVVAAFDGLRTAVSKTIDAVSSVVRFFDRNRDLAEALAGAIVAITVAYGTYTAVTKTISAVTKAYTAVQTALNSSFLANPVFLVIAGIVALGAALFVAYQRSERFRNIVDAIGRFMRDELLPILQNIGTALVAAFESAVDAVRGAFDVLAPIVTTAVGVVIAIIQTLVATVQTVISVVTALWSTFGSSITAVLGGAFTILSGIVSGAFAIIKGFFDVFIGLVTGDWGQFWDGLTGVVSGVWTTIQGVVEGAVGIVGGLISGLVAGLKAGWDAAWDSLKDAPGAALDAVVGFVESLPGRLEGLLGNVGTAAAKIGSTILEKIKEGVGAVGGIVGDVAGSIKDALKRVVDSTVLGPLRGALNTMAHGFAAINIPGVGRAFDAASSTIEGLADHLRLANGGLAYGPTRAIVGDNPNARTNPEVVAPLDALVRILRKAGVTGASLGEITIQAPTYIQAPVYGVNDLGAFFDDRDRKLANALRGGTLRVVT